MTMMKWHFITEPGAVKVICDRGLDFVVFQVDWKKQTHSLLSQKEKPIYPSGNKVAIKILDGHSIGLEVNDDVCHRLQQELNSNILATIDNVT